jgi:hypothetical protein
MGAGALAGVIATLHPSSNSAIRRIEATVPSVLYLLVVVCIAVLFGFIFRKMGYSRWAGAFSVIPIVNLVWLLYIATTEWPIERQLRLSLDAEATPPPDHLALMLRRAELFENRGHYEEAMELFEILATELNGAPGSRFAMHCAQRLKQRIQPRQITTSGS